VEAWKRVKANQGAAGVDEESLRDFERKLKDNLYRAALLAGQAGPTRNYAAHAKERRAQVYLSQFVSRPLVCSASFLPSINA
jgi:hypothetical protein